MCSYILACLAPTCCCRLAGLSSLPPAPLALSSSLCVAVRTTLSEGRWLL